MPFIWSLLRGTLVHDVEKLHCKYGPAVRIAPDEVTFAHADAYPDIFQARSDSKPFLKDSVWWETQPGLPDTILSAINPEKHARIRRILAPGFTLRALRDQEPILHQYVNLLVDRLRESTLESSEAQVNLVPWLNFTTFDIIGDLGFGDSFNCLQHSRYHPWTAMLFSTVKAAAWVASARYYPLIEFILLKCIPPSLMKTQTDHYRRISDKVDRRLNFEMERPDVLSYVIKKREEEAVPIGEINSTFMILTTAGSETPATLLSGIMNYLVNCPDKLNTLKHEVRHNFNTSDDITLDALKDLPYLNAVINEGFRMCPPVPWVLPRRVPNGGSTVCGTWLPGGVSCRMYPNQYRMELIHIQQTAVSVQAYTINRNSSYFHCASSFVPERWLPEVHGNPESPFSKDCRGAIQPFSLGPRSCLGQNLAMAELRLIISKLVWAFDFETIDGNVLNWEDLRVFLLIEKKPIQVKIKPRSEAPTGT